MSSPFLKEYNNVKSQFVVQFKETYANKIASDIEFKQLKTYVKIRKLKRANELNEACDMLIKGKFITNSQYEELLAYVEENRGNCVWQLGLEYVIDFWNIKFDGMDQCFFVCCNIKNVPITCPNDIYKILTGPIHTMHNCCAVREHLLKKS